MSTGVTLASSRPYDSDPATSIDPRRQLTVSAAPPPFDTTLELLDLTLAANSHAKLDTIE
ncbi:Helicase C-terminal [Penicillium expansum]|nr:Helicase C-terminal [Penicillium expansum]